MFDKDLYIKEIFEKCKKTENQKKYFFEKEISFNKKFKLIPQLIACIILFVGVGALAYTGVTNNSKQRPGQSIPSNQS